MDVTGTIVELVAERRTGFILADDGSRVGFCASAVLGRQYDYLAVGQRVSFEREARGGAAARVQRELLSRAARKTDRPMQLRYTGFDQNNNIREFRFESVAYGTASERFVVTADLGLFAEKHVGMQEGPALCLQKLSTDLEASRTSRHELTAADLQAYVAARGARERRTGRRRRPPKPQPAGSRAAHAERNQI